jgi:hypothetical protein
MIFNNSIIIASKNQPKEITPLDPTYKSPLLPPYISPVDIKTPFSHISPTWIRPKFFPPWMGGNFFMCKVRQKLLFSKILHPEEWPENFSLSELRENCVVSE